MFFVRILLNIVLAAELINDERIGFRLNLCNGVNFVDLGKKTKSPMRYPEQIAHLKQMIVDYNGHGKLDYENIEIVLIDSGSGGGGRFIADDLMDDWTDKNGLRHYGMVDSVEHEEYLSRFPSAKDKLRLLSPKKYKVEAFEALVEMLNLGLISFTEEYDGKGYIMQYKDSEFEFIDEDGSVKKDINREMLQYSLSFEEDMALKQIDLCKEEIANFYRYDLGNGGCRYDLSPEQSGKMNDDRAYCLAMLAWYLQRLRRGQKLERPREAAQNVNPSMFVSEVSF